MSALRLLPIALLVCACGTPAPVPRASALASSAPSTAPSEAPPAKTRPAMWVTTRDLPDTVEYVVHPSGVTFEVAHTSAGYLYSGASRSQVETCKGPWEQAYARVANAAVPFESLAAHIGTHGFCDSQLFTNTHIRLYLVDAPPEAVVERIRTGAAKEIAKLPDGGAPVRGPDDSGGRWSPKTDIPGWTFVPVGYTLRFDDYGGGEKLDFFVRRVAERTVVVVFMYVRSPVYEANGVRVDPIASAVSSVRVTSEPSSSSPPSGPTEEEVYVAKACECHDYGCVNGLLGSPHPRVGLAHNGHLNDCFARVVRESQKP